MAQGSVITGYSSGTFGGGTPTSPKPIASSVLKRNNIPSKNITGSPLTGYDIKAQDSITILKLSLLADGQKQSFPEVYVDADGIPTVVFVGTTLAPINTLKGCFFKTENNTYISRVDHVLVKAKDPLPTRYHGGSVNVMGGGHVNAFGYTCITGNPVKNTSLSQEAWAVFGRSPQSKSTQDMLKALVQRSQWEQLVGYKVSFADMPSYASMSLSQQTPTQIGVPFTNDFNTSMTITLGDNLPDGGGILDISGLNGIGAPVLDLVKGSDLLKLFPDLSNEPFYDFGDTDYYCLLDHDCGIMSINRGTNWYLLAGGGNTANLLLRRSSGSKDTYDAFNSFETSVKYFRRKEAGIATIADMLNANKQLNGSYFGLGSTAFENPWRGQIVVGIGGNFGIELTNLQLACSIAQPSIQIKSPKGDAVNIASRFASGGIVYSAIIVQDKPAGTGWNGQVVHPPAPPDDEAEAFDVDSPIDELEGTVVDISAPYLGDGGAAQLSSTIHSLINGDAGRYKSYSFKSGGYGILPGMKYDDSYVQSIEFVYSDRDVVATNITTGPRYYPIGSYPDSQYVKRSETITRDARVVAGSNSEGAFIVEVDGLGRYEAINTLIEPIYPGDRVEVRVLNVPVELD